MRAYRTLGIIFFFMLLQKSEVGLSQDSSEMRQRRLMSLVDYIRGDYAQAVQNGEVQSDLEYGEMLEFAGTALELGATELSSNVAIQVQLEALKEAVVQKASVSKVQDLAADIRQGLLVSLDLSHGPTGQPEFAEGARVYNQMCASCHGEQGYGDGAAAQGMEPAPRNFHDVDAMQTASALKFFNIQNTGLEGTSMMSYREVLSQQDMWNVAFYVLGLRHQTAELQSLTQEQWLKLEVEGLDLEMLSTYTDGDLQSWLEQKFAEASLAQLRQELPPVRQGREKMIINLMKLEKVVDRAWRFAEEQEYQAVRLLLTDGYLDLFEPLEAFLRVEAPEQTLKLEQAFLNARAFAKQESSQVFAPLKDARQGLVEIRMHIQENKESRPVQEFLSGLLIILREGFEALLVVAALLAMANNLGATRARWMVHLGWVSAIFAGALVWYGMEFIWAVSGRQRELMEAVFTGLAVLMLLYTGFWLLSQADHKQWGQYVKKESQQATQSGKYWGVFALSFVAVFREAAETILFYQALSHRVETPLWMGSGFVIGVFALCVLAWLILRLNLRLPLQTFFRATSSLMVLLAVILAGQSVYEFMAAGYLTPTPLPMIPTLTMIGVYPSLETVGVQVLLLCCGFFGTLYMLRQQRTETAAQVAVKSVQT